ncbi:MAG: hypothetical protein BZ138_06625, partial [Methanosphaera sp. rholeuAM270]
MRFKQAMDAFPDDKLVPVFRIDVNAVECLLSPGFVTLGAILEAMRKSPQRSRDIDVSGTTVVLSPEQKRDFDKMNKSQAALDCDVLLFREAGSRRDYKNIACMLVERSTRGYCREVPWEGLHHMTFDEFIVASYEALSAGKISLSSNDFAAAPPTLRNFYVSITSPSGLKLDCRMDYVLAGLKNAGNPNMYGGVPDAIVPWSEEVNDNANMIKWRVAYGIRSGEKPDNKQLGTTDHVVPLSLNGRDRLVNMQLLKSEENSSKASRYLVNFSDPAASAEVIRLVMDGAEAAHDRGDMPSKTYKRLMWLVGEELSAIEQDYKEKEVERRELSLEANARNLARARREFKDAFKTPEEKAAEREAARKAKE